MPSGYRFVGGPYEIGEDTKVTADTIARGDALKHSSGQLTVLTAGTKNMGVSTGANAGTAGTIQYLRCYPDRTKFQATVKANSLAAADMHQYLPMSGLTGAMGVDATPTAGGDWFLYAVLVTGTAGECIVLPADPGQLNAVE